MHPAQKQRAVPVCFPSPKPSAKPLLSVGFVLSPVCISAPWREALQRDRSKRMNRRQSTAAGKKQTDPETAAERNACRHEPDRTTGAEPEEKGWHREKRCTALLNRWIRHAAEESLNDISVPLHGGCAKKAEMDEPSLPFGCLYAVCFTVSSDAGAVRAVPAAFLP